jgi:hypothetical protein
VAPPT